MRSILLLLVLIAAPIQAAQGWLTDLDAAKREAAASKRDLVILFTGSDWCPPCMAMHDAIFSKEEFLAVATQRFVLVELDYPRGRPQPDDEIERNRRWQALYGIQAFPTIVLADAQGRPYAEGERAGRDGPAPGEYAAQLIARMPIRAERDAALAKAMALSGAERAKALAEVIERLGEPDRLGPFRPEIEMLIALDADGALGFRSVWKSRLVTMDALAKGQSGGPQAADAVLAAGLEDPAIRGEPRQQLLLMRANIVFSAGDRVRTVALLREAIAAAPESEDGKMLGSVIERLAADAAGSATPPGAAPAP